MKINIFLSLIVLVLSTILGYWVFAVAGDDSHAVLAGVFSTICFTIPLVLAFGIDYTTSVANVNIKLTSTATLFLMIVSHFYYAAKGISMPYYVLVNGVLICIYATIVYFIFKFKQ